MAASSGPAGVHHRRPVRTAAPGGRLVRAARTSRRLTLAPGAAD